MADSFFATLISKDANLNAVTNPIFVELSDGTSPITTFTVVQPTGSNLHVQVDAGTAVIGHVITDTGSTTVVTGNVTVVQPTGTNLHVVVDSATLGTVATNLTQVGGSAISEGQKTMANSLPVVIASDQSAIPVSSAISAQTGAVSDYATAASVSGGATSNHDYTVVTSMKLTQVSFASSGGGKVELKVGPVASLVSKWVSFVPKTGGQTQIAFNPPILIPTTSTGTVRLVMTNREGLSQDLYSTIVGVDA